VEKRRKRKRRESQDGAEAESCATEMMAPDRVQQCSVHAAREERPGGATASERSGPGGGPWHEEGSRNGEKVLDP
jgi:hypothetical protein